MTRPGRPLPSDQEASGRSFGPEELDALRRVLDSGTLTSTKGTAVSSLERRFCELVGSDHALACTSGTAAVHLAVLAIDPEPGDEIITTPITDMGALAPILHQGAIPVFADVDPETLLVTPESVEARLSDRTRAIIATHLFGRCCDMEGLRRVAERRGVPLIEDAAQAFLASWNGQLAGTMGNIGCFSLQQGKHITTGEGGLVTTDDPALARRIKLGINKAWPYGEPDPDHEFLALNYRMSEVVGAVACAQLEKLARGVEARIARADDLSSRIADLPGLSLPTAPNGGVHSYWRYTLGVDGRVLPGGSRALGAYLQERGIACAPRYIQKPAFRCRVFAERRTFGRSQWPFTLAREEALDWSSDRFPGVHQGLEAALVLPWNERYEEADIDHLASSLRAGVQALRAAA